MQYIKKKVHGAIIIWSTCAARWKFNPLACGLLVKEREREREREREDLADLARAKIQED